MTARGQVQRRPGLGATPGQWVKQADCRDTEWPDAWHATDSQSGEMAYALKVCRTCPVRIDCLEFALSLAPSEAQGIWGATTPGAREHLWRQRRGAA